MEIVQERKEANLSVPPRTDVADLAQDRDLLVDLRSLAHLSPQEAFAAGIVLVCQAAEQFWAKCDRVPETAAAVSFNDALNSPDPFVSSLAESFVRNPAYDREDGGCCRESTVSALESSPVFATLFTKLVSHEGSAAYAHGLRQVGEHKCAPASSEASIGKLATLDAWANLIRDTLSSVGSVLASPAVGEVIKANFVAKADFFGHLAVLNVSLPAMADAGLTSTQSETRYLIGALAQNELSRDLFMHTMKPAEQLINRLQHVESGEVKYQLPRDLSKWVDGTIDWRGALRALGRVAAGADALAALGKEVFGSTEDAVRQSCATRSLLLLKRSRFEPAADRVQFHEMVVKELFQRIKDGNFASLPELCEATAIVAPRVVPASLLNLVGGDPRYASLFQEGQPLAAHAARVISDASLRRVLRQLTPKGLTRAVDDFRCGREKLQSLLEKRNPTSDGSMLSLSSIGERLSRYDADAAIPPAKADLEQIRHDMRQFAEEQVGKRFTVTRSGRPAEVLEVRSSDPADGEMRNVMLAVRFQHPSKPWPIHSMLKAETVYNNIKEGAWQEEAKAVS